MWIQGTDCNYKFDYTTVIVALALSSPHTITPSAATGNARIRVHLHRANGFQWPLINANHRSSAGISITSVPFLSVSIGVLGVTAELASFSRASSIREKAVSLSRV